MTLQTRQEFEKWFAPEKIDARSIERDGKGEYKLMAASVAWRVWQAATELAEEKIRAMVKLSERQQNALAELAQLAAGVKHKLETEATLPSNKEADTLFDIVDRFRSVNWGEVYDKMHRSGANSL